MGNSVAAAEQEDAMIPSGSTVSGALSSLWSTSSDKDDTCVQWGLVCGKSSLIKVVQALLAYDVPQAI